jgi:hypothetical protein
MQSEQTGILDSATRGLVQTRQSEGSKTAEILSSRSRAGRNSLSARPGERSPQARTATEAGTRSPVLLKTTLQVAGTFAEANATGHAMQPTGILIG